MVVRTVFLVLMLSATAICAQYSGGTGEPNDPYQIATATDLMPLGESPEDYDKHFILTADIDLDPNLPGGQVFDRAVIAPALDRNPDRNTLFTGVFDGNGHTISHLTIEGDEYLGLFGQIGSGARISNLALESVDINGTGEIGILAGVNEGHIINCSSTGSVSARSKHIGGLVGRNYGDIAQCFSDCVISGEGLAVGGLVGRNDGTISNCYCGGIIEGTQKTGGFVGYNLASVTNSYSSASVVSERSINGFVGDNEWQVHNCFWDVQTSGRLSSEGGTRKTTAEMQTESTFTDAGWDFVDETANGTEDIWWIAEGRVYPRLWWEKLYVDDDAPDDPGPGNPQISDPLECGRQAHPFDTIQEAIDVAPDGLTILVRGGIYGEPIDFRGKAITVRSEPDMAVLEAPGDYAVSFFSGEEPNSVLQNFVIRNSLTGIYVSGSSPTIRNLTVVDNQYGIAAYTWAQPDISNCIFWNNSGLDLFQCEARYSCIEDGDPGEGNLSADPLFINADSGDYHLLSAGWCWSTETNSWTYATLTSPCIDAGDPDSPLGDELLSVPRDPDNEYGVNLRINMGAYGGTAQASMAPLGWTP